VALGRALGRKEKKNKKTKRKEKKTRERKKDDLHHFQTMCVHVVFLIVTPHNGKVWDSLIESYPKKGGVGAVGVRENKIAKGTKHFSKKVPRYLINITRNMPNY